MLNFRMELGTHNMFTAKIFYFLKNCKLELLTLNFYKSWKLVLKYICYDAILYLY